MTDDFNECRRHVSTSRLSRTRCDGVSMFEKRDSIDRRPWSVRNTPSPAIVPFNIYAATHLRGFKKSKRTTMIFLRPVFYPHKRMPNEPFFRRLLCV
jgi:hypothetical protein